MPRPILLPVLPVLALLALSACGGDGTSTATGEVTTTERRLCVSADQDETSRCFASAPELLSGLALGACVEVEYEQGGDGRVGRATAVRPSRGC